MTTRFTDGLWAEIGSLYRSILDLPFNRELAAGTLSRERFTFYMIQDAHYLGQFARALALVAAKAPSADAQIKFARSAHDAIVVERALHEGFFEAFGVDEAAWRATPPSPTCALYNKTLLATTALEPFAVGLAAVLPCFQIYWEVGRHLLRTAVRPNPYQRWIDTYADEEFGRSVAEVLSFTDAARETASAVDRQAMRDAYLMASRLEWMFWDSAYRLEAWPI